MMHSLKVIKVDARQDADGKWHPRQMWLGDVCYQIASTGRRWVDEVGEHILAQLVDLRVEELVHDHETGIWYLKPRAIRRV